MNPTETLAPKVAVPEYYRQVNAEWDELAARYPPPTPDEVRAEWRWVYEPGAEGAIDPAGKYWGLHVAIYRRKIVGADVEPSRLRVRVARELGIHPERMITVYLGDIRPIVDPTSTDREEYYRASWAEWDELAAKYPAPTLDDVRPEWVWVHEHAADGSIDPDGRYAGLHVAVYNQRVVGADADPTRLQIRLSREFGIHPERFVVTYLPEW